MNLASLWQPGQETCVGKLLSQVLCIRLVFFWKGAAHINEFGVLGAPTIMPRELIENVSLKLFRPECFAVHKRRLEPVLKSRSEGVISSRMKDI